MGSSLFPDTHFQISLLFGIASLYYTDFTPGDPEKSFWRAMWCFNIANAHKSHEKKSSNSTSGSSTSISTDQDGTKLGSESNSRFTSDASNNASPVKASFANLSQRNSNLKEFTFAEMKEATKNFSHSLMIGEGGFGAVFKGLLRETDEQGKRVGVAIKQLSRRGLQGHKEWVTEVNVLGVVDHPNLVKLIGYCAEDDERGIQRLLVYEYMPNHSVRDCLAARFQPSLPWETRLSIAQDAARGLAYLHEGMEFQIIFRDFKSSNILLDDQWNAKLSDFGLARLGPVDGIGHVSTAVVGTIGYAAPEYIQTGRLTSKSDVWSYGIFLYELITGRRPFDRNRPKTEQKLLEWVRPHLSDMKKFEQILDPCLDGKYDIKSAQKLAAIANRCLEKHPKNRPRMSEVLEILNHVVDTTIATPEAAPGSSPLNDESEKLSDVCPKKGFMDIVTRENKLLDWRSWKPCLVWIN